jgi:hypothetical protein
MNNLPICSGLMTQARAKEASDGIPLFKSMPFVNLSPTLSLRYIFLDVAYGTRPRPMRKPGFILFVLCSLLTMALAATDCEILNSGIASISSTGCCGTAGITCVNGRVTEMYEFYVFNSVSKLDDVDGHLPFEIGNFTELIEINIADSDLSAGPVPESIGFCTKLVKVQL